MAAHLPPGRVRRPRAAVRRACGRRGWSPATPGAATGLLPRAPRLFARTLRRQALGPAHGPGQTPDLARSVLHDATTDSSDASPLTVDVRNDETAGIYEAIVDGATIGGIPYNLVGADRIALLAVSVLPDFRGLGVSMELIRRALDDVRAQGRTVINYCPVVHTFIENNPGYADLIDSDHHRRVAGRARP